MDYDSLTDDEIRAKLVAAGVSVGPVVASTRPVYIKKLRRLAGEEVDPPSTEQHYRVEEDDELPEADPPRRVSPTKTARPMSARPRQPLHDQTSDGGRDDVRQRRASPRKKLDVKMEKHVEETGGGFTRMLAMLIGFMVLFAVLYFLISTYMSDNQPNNLISESG